MAGTTTYYGISYPTSTDYVKDGATAMQTIATGFDSAVAIPTYNNQTGTSYTFVLADAGKTVTSNNASAVTFTIPPQASVAWANNTTLTVRNLGAGVVTIAGGSGVTVTNTAQTVAQYGEVKLIRTASNAWTVVPASGSEAGMTLINTQALSASSGISFTDVFSSTYSHYRVVMNLTSSADCYIRIRARMGSSDYTGTNGGGAAYYFGTASNTAFNYSSSANAFGTIDRVDAGNAFYGFDVYPVTTSMTFSGTGWGTYAYALTVFGSTIGATSSNVTGFTIYPSTGTLTGTIALYGYKKTV